MSYRAKGAGDVWAEVRRLKLGGASWPEIGRAVGRNAEACRKMWQARRTPEDAAAARGLTPVSAVVRTPQAAEPEADAPERDPEADVRVKLLLRENSKLKRRASDRDAVRSILRSAFEQSFETPAGIVVPRAPAAGSGGEESAVLHLSDLHFGKSTETYSSAVAAKRVETIGERLAEITRLRRSRAKIRTLHLKLGGDMVEGEGIFPGQPFELDACVADAAVRDAPRALCGLILGALEEFPAVHVTAVPGNHGRGGRESSKRSNWDSVCYQVARWMVEAAVAKSRPSRLGDVTWDLPMDRPHGREWYAHEVVQGWGLMLVHGDQFRGWGGFPFASAGRRALQWIDSVPHAWDALFFGHFHQDALFMHNGRWIVASGTTECGNSYAAAELGAVGTPIQKLMFFNKSKGLISVDPLYLDDGRKPNR